MRSGLARDGSHFEGVERGNFGAGFLGDFFEQSGSVARLGEEHADLEFADFVDERGELTRGGIFFREFRDGADVIQSVARRQIREGIVERDEVFVR